MLHKVEGAELAGDVVVADDLVPADAGVVAEPGGELHQAVVTGLVKLSGLVRVTDLDGEGVDIPVVAGGGLFVQGDALDDLAVQADEEVRADGGGRLVVEIVVLLGGGAGVADVVDDDVIDGLQLFASAAGTVDLDDLLVHPAGGVVPGQLAQLAAGDVGDHGTDHNDGRKGDGQHRDQGKLLPAATAAGLPLPGGAGTGGLGGHEGASFFFLNFFRWDGWPGPAKRPPPGKGGGRWRRGPWRGRR